MAVLPLHFRQSFHRTVAMIAWRGAVAVTRRAMANNAVPSDSNRMKDALSKYANYFNDLNDKRERLVKASRDVTMSSKKVIFQVHRFKNLLKLQQFVTFARQLADLSGELMRMAIGHISDGEPEFTQKICWFLREIHAELILLAPEMDDSSNMKIKIDTMLQSVMKIENACMSVHIRGSEDIPLGAGDAIFNLLQEPDNE